MICASFGTPENNHPLTFFNPRASRGNYDGFGLAAKRCFGKKLANFASFPPSAGDSALF